MSTLKISEIACIIILFFTLQLGACAKEIPAPASKKTASEKALPELEQEDSVQAVIEPNLTIKEEINNATEISVKTAESKPEIKVNVIQEETIAVSAAELPKKVTQLTTEIRSEIEPEVQVTLEEKTAAQAMLNLDQYKGKVVYLDFWASWCVPCQQTFPWMDAMQKKYPDDIVFIAVNFGENPEDTQEFLQRFPADIKFVYDPLMQIASEYGIPGLPYSFIYGREGDLLGKHAGFSGGSEINLEAALNNLFATGK